jgi:hypothetical protein
MNGFRRTLLPTLLVISFGAPSIAAEEGRRWQLFNPGQNSNSVSFEVRGLGPSDAEWDNETPVTSGRLSPGHQLVLNCDGWGALDIKWHLNIPESNPEQNTFFARLACIEENFLWNNVHNLRHFDFPRQ